VATLGSVTGTANPPQAPTARLQSAGRGNDAEAPKKSGDGNGTRLNILKASSG